MSNHKLLRKLNILRLLQSYTSEKNVDSVDNLRETLMVIHLGIDCAGAVTDLPKSTLIFVPGSTSWLLKTEVNGNSNPKDLITALTFIQVKNTKIIFIENCAWHLWCPTIVLCPSWIWSQKFLCYFSFAQWHYRSQWGSSEARLLLIENFSQYPARRLEIQPALQFLTVHTWTL